MSPAAALCVLSGLPAAGKSRLARELRGCARGRGWRTLLVTYDDLIPARDWRQSEWKQHRNTVLMCLERFLHQTLSDQTRTLSDQTRTLSDQTRTLSDQTRTHSDQTRTHSDQTRTLSDQTHTLSDQDQTQTRTLSDQTHTLSDQTHTHSDQTRTHSDQDQTHTHSDHTLSDQTHTISDQDQTRTHSDQTQTRTLSDQTHTLSDQTHTHSDHTLSDQTGTHSDQDQTRTHSDQTQTCTLSDQTRTHLDETHALADGVWMRFEQMRQQQSISNTHSQPLVVLLDDNFYYQSMRYQVQQLARKYGVGYCQVFLQCPLNVCLQRNRSRPQPVPDDVLLLMCERMERPNKIRNPWEQQSLTLDSTDGFVDGHVQKLMDLLASALENPLRSVQDDSQQKEADRQICASSVLHQADQTCRRIVSQALSSAHEGKATRDEQKALAKALTQLKTAFLQELKDDILHHVSFFPDEPNNMEKLLQDVSVAFRRQIARHRVQTHD